MTPDKQHPDSVNRDLDEEVATAIEHQYARRLIKPAGNDTTDKAGKNRFDKDPEKPHGEGNA